MDEGEEWRSSRVPLSIPTSEPETTEVNLRTPYPNYQIPKELRTLQKKILNTSSGWPYKDWNFHTRMTIMGEILRKRYKSKCLVNWYTPHNWWSQEDSSSTSTPPPPWQSHQKLLRKSRWQHTCTLYFWTRPLGVYHKKMGSEREGGKDKGNSLKVRILTLVSFWGTKLIETHARTHTRRGPTTVELFPCTLQISNHTHNILYKNTRMRKAVPTKPREGITTCTGCCCSGNTSGGEGVALQG